MPVERELHAVGHGRRRERVAGADRLHPLPASAARRTIGGDLLRRPRRRPLGGQPALVAGPVGQRRRHRRSVRLLRSGSYACAADDPVHGTCHHDCPDSCGWTVTVDDGVAVKLRGRVDHPYSAGELCPKVNRFLDRVYSPDRVLHPLRRTGPEGLGLVRADLVGRRAGRDRRPPARRDRPPRRRGGPAVQRRRQPEPAGDDGPQRALLQRPRREPAGAGDLRPDRRPRHADDERQRPRARPAGAAPLAS